MINRIRNTGLFYILYLLFFGIATVYFLYGNHGDFVVWFNSMHNPVWDTFFKYYTYTGSVYFFIAVTIFLIIIKRRHGFIISMVGIGVSLVTSIFKFVIFPDVARPKVFFEGQRILAEVEGVELLDFQSFPSGHSMAGFALATFIALTIQKPKFSLLLFVLAAFTALSRVYLSQHFLLDIMAGSLLGVIIATGYYVGFEKYLNREHHIEENTPDEDLANLDLDD